MTSAIDVIKSALGSIWDELLMSAVYNLLWLLAIVLLIPGPPATLALFYVANRMANGEVVDLSDFTRAFKRYWGIGWRWGLINLLLLFILVGDIFLTGRLSTSPAARIFQGFYLAALAVWVLVQIFALPFLFEQKEPNLRQALRNSIVLIGRNLAFAVGVGLLTGLVVLLGTALFMISGAAGGIFVALVGNHAVLNRLKGYRQTNSLES